MNTEQLLNRFVKLHIDKLKEQLLFNRDVLEEMNEDGEVDPLELLDMTANAKLINDYRQSLEYAKTKLMGLSQLHFYKHEDNSIQWDDQVMIPTRATDNSAGLDFYAPYDITLEAKGTCIIDTGIGCVLPPMTMLGIYSRSGWAFKHNIAVVNGVGVIDRDFKGSIKVKLINHGDESIEIKTGDRIAQGILQPIYMVNPNVIDYEQASEKYHEMDKNAKVKRDGGFGSTGK